MNKSESNDLEDVNLSPNYRRCNATDIETGKEVVVPTVVPSGTTQSQQERAHVTRKRALGKTLASGIIAVFVIIIIVIGLSVGLTQKEKNQVALEVQSDTAATTSTVATTTCCTETETKESAEGDTNSDTPILPRPVIVDEDYGEFQLSSKLTFHYHSTYALTQSLFSQSFRCIS